MNQYSNIMFSYIYNQAYAQDVAFSLMKQHNKKEISDIKMTRDE